MVWDELWKTIIGAGIGTALVQGGITLWLHFTTGRNSARFLIIRVAIQLEAYARACSIQMADFRNHMSSRGQMGSLSLELPTFPEYPGGADEWQSVDPQIIDNSFRLKAEVQRHQETIDFWVFELGDYDEAYSAVYERCAVSGLAAWRTAVAFRQRYGFPQNMDDTPENLASHRHTKQKFYSFG